MKDNEYQLILDGLELFLKQIEEKIKLNYPKTIHDQDKYDSLCDARNNAFSLKQFIIKDKRNNMKWYTHLTRRITAMCATLSNGNTIHYNSTIHNNRSHFKRAVKAHLKAFDDVFAVVFNDNNIIECIIH